MNWTDATRTSMYARQEARESQASEGLHDAPPEFHHEPAAQRAPTIAAPPRKPRRTRAEIQAAQAREQQIRNDADHAPYNELASLAIASSQAARGTAAAEIADGPPAAAAIARQIQREATADEYPPVPPAAAAELASATAKRAAVVAEIHATTAARLSKLDQIVEELVREHSSGAVIDAAWSAGKRLFHPNGGRA